MCKLSIGVCTYNRVDIINDCVSAILSSVSNSEVANSSDVEVIVIDNNSTDGTSDVLKLSHDFLHGGFKYILEEKQGLSHARNRFLEESSGELLLFLDDDALLASNAIEEYIRVADKYRYINFFGGMVCEEKFEGKPRWFDSHFHMAYSILDLGRITSKFPNKLGPIGANFMIRRSVVANIKFRTDLGRVGCSLLSGEETDFLVRAGINRNNSLYVGTASVVHCFSRERYTKEWAVQRFQLNGKSDWHMRNGFKGKTIGFFSQIYHFLSSFKSLNPFYIQCRFYSLLIFCVCAVR
ncbi:glycosyltransferase family 2 protein [Vibrio vulnificus]|uniref:glycosyltransferase family 2 protein n=1 Tax=Vibrio vulnificus TaxID=672 RepID=UPI003EDB0140